MFLHHIQFGVILAVLQSPKLDILYDAISEIQYYKFLEIIVTREDGHFAFADKTIFVFVVDL